MTDLDAFQWILVSLTVVLGVLSIARLSSGSLSVAFSGAYIVVVGFYVIYSVFKALSG